MKVVETISWVFGLLGFLFAMTACSKVEKLEKRVRELEGRTK